MRPAVPAAKADGSGGDDGMEPRTRDLIGIAALVVVLVALIVLIVVAALPS